MFIYLNKRAQSVAEYVIVLGLIIGAVMAMQTYVKRGLQGRLKDAIDYADTGGQGGLQFTTKQYDPYYLAGSQVNSTQNVQDTEGVTEGGGEINRTSNAQSAKEGYSVTGAAPGFGQ